MGELNMLQISNVNKSFGTKHVLHDVSLALTAGVHGLLGPNGAGKTTLLRCILGLLPYEGSIVPDAKEAGIGYLPQQFRMFPELRVEQAMEYIALLKETDDSVPAVMEWAHLLPERTKKVRHLSGGMLRRFGIAQALLGTSEILLLDEPTVGLDPKERVYLRNLIAELGEDHLILYSTHIVEDVEHVADTVTILTEGVIRHHGSVQALLASHNGQFGQILIPPSALDALEKTVQVLQVRPVHGHLLCKVYGEPLPPEAEPAPATLEDVYLAMAGKDA